ncbi:hypothetical protein V6N12_023358 [Hibiscus sabdariffa]|uniref:Uncharacterized protein n=1 Tax=Hibiscus sabdariffa TaxID=183260 RepID=A0ABR2FXG8_9ROSI
MEMEMEMDKGKQIQRLHLHWHPLVLVEAQGQGQGQGDEKEKEKEKEKADDDDDDGEEEQLYCDMCEEKRREMESVGIIHALLAIIPFILNVLSEIIPSLKMVRLLTGSIRITPITVISVMSAGLLRAIRIAGNAVSLANMMSSSVPNVTTSSTSTVGMLSALLFSSSSSSLFIYIDIDIGIGIGIIITIILTSNLLL